MAEERNDIAFDTGAIQQLQADAGKAAATMDVLLKMLGEIQAQGIRTFTGIGQTITTGLQPKLVRAREETEKLSSSLYGLTGSSVQKAVKQISDRMDTMASSAREANREAKELTENLGKNKENNVKSEEKNDTTNPIERASTKNKIKYSIKDVEQGNVALKDLLTNPFKGIGKVASGTASGFKTVFSALGGFIDTLQAKWQGLKNVMGIVTKPVLDGWQALQSKLSTLGQSLAKLPLNALNALFGAQVKNGLQELGGQLISMVTSSRQVQSAMNDLSIAFSQMVSPIASVVSPALAALTSGLATVMSYAARLFSFLTGKSIKSAKGTAAAVGKVGKSASGTAKKVEEATRSLAGFDEIQRLDKPKQGSSSGGGGGGGSGGSIGAEPAFDPQSDFLDKLLDAIEAGNWFQVGELLADKLNEALARIPWEKIDATVRQWGENLGRMVNGLVTFINWPLLGESFANGFNALFHGVNTFFGRVNWQFLGHKLGEGLNRMVSTLDWAALGTFLTNKCRAAFETLWGFVRTFDFDALGSGIAASIDAAFANISWEHAGGGVGGFAKGILDTVRTALQEADWNQIGTDIRTFFESIDWNGIASSLGTLLGAAVHAAFELLGGLLQKPFDFLKEKFMEGFSAVVGDSEEAMGANGELLIQGLFQGILNALASVGAWIMDNVFRPIAEGFKSAFGIHSPSTVAAEWGGDIIAGLKQGLVNAWTDIVAFFTGKLATVRQTVVDAWTAIRERTAAIWQALKTTVGELVAALRQSVADKLAALRDSAVALWNTLKERVSGIVRELRESVEGTWDGLCDGIRSALDALGSAFSSVWAGIVNTVKGAVETVSGFIEGIGNAIDKAIQGVKGLVGASNSAMGKAGRTAAAISAAAALPAPVHAAVPVYRVPALAHGAVIPANREFLALLGDQRQGTNVEAPLATIEQAVANVLDSQLTAMMAGFEAVVAAIREQDNSVVIGDEVIGRAAARYQQRLAVIRGGVV